VFNGGFRIVEVGWVQIHLNHIVFEVHEKLGGFRDIHGRQHAHLFAEKDGLQQGLPAQRRIPEYVKQFLCHARFSCFPFVVPDRCPTLFFHL
jgi:hypothetical protein